MQKETCKEKETSLINIKMGKLWANLQHYKFRSSNHKVILLPLKFKNQQQKQSSLPRVKELRQLIHREELVSILKLLLCFKKWIIEYVTFERNILCFMTSKNQSFAIFGSQICCRGIHC
jgi:hypothetical protein